MVIGPLGMAMDITVVRHLGPSPRLFLLWTSVAGLPEVKARAAKAPKDEMSTSVLLILALTMGSWAGDD